MEKIKGQANKVGELIFASETGATYKRTLTLTWDILRETGVLLWLVICLVFVGAEWFWKNSISLGRSSRSWYEGLKEPSAEEPKSATAMGQSALTALGTGAETLLYNAKKQLGLDAQPPTPKSTPVAAPPKAPIVPEEPTTGASPTTVTSSSATDAPTAPSMAEENEGTDSAKKDSK